VTNTKAIWAFVMAVLSLGVFGGTALVEYGEQEIRLEHAVVAVPLALVLALAAVFLARRARVEHQRTLGRSGSRGFIALGRFLGAFALLLALTAALALVVFAVLLLALD
jgi:uncharacterized membrane protein